MIGQQGGTTDTDDAFARKSMENVGAWIMGRNMFGPIRGRLPDHSWKGWWGDNPPYHVPVFVLTHHPRPPLEMEGGTVFHFVTDGIEAALAQATKVAGGKDVRIGGGVSVVRQYLQAGLLDELHLAVSPVLLGKGENLFSGLDHAGSSCPPVSRACGRECVRVCRGGHDSRACFNTTRLQSTTFSSAPPALKAFDLLRDIFWISSASVYLHLCGVSTTLGWLRTDCPAAVARSPKTSAGGTRRASSGAICRLRSAVRCRGRH